MKRAIAIIVMGAAFAAGMVAIAPAYTSALPASKAAPNSNQIPASFGGIAGFDKASSTTVLWGVTESTKRCWTNTSSTHTENTFGFTLFRYEVTVQWCTNRSTGDFVEGPSVVGELGTNLSWGWHYDGRAGFSRVRLSNGDYRVIVQGKFCLADYIGYCRNPRITFVIHPDGANNGPHRQTSVGFQG